MNEERQQSHRVAFLGTHNWRAHMAVRWWDSAHGAGERAASEAAAPHRRTDVFGIARPEMPADAAKHLAHLQWLALKPGSDTRVAAAKGVEAVVCSGQGPNDVQIAKECRAAGKAVFVESLESFTPADLADLAAQGEQAPLLMSGLYLRFDAASQEVAELGIESVVGRPLLYQAHASTLAPSLQGKDTLPGDSSIPFPSRMRNYPVSPSLFDLGIQQVDALRWLLKAEPTEVYAAGTNGSGAADDINAYEALSLTIKTDSGALAVLTLDASGGAARQRVQIVGDQSRCALAGKSSAPELQEAGINHFLDCVTAAAEPRVTATDALRAAAVMAAARESLRTGAPAAVDYSLTSAAAAAAAGEAPLAGATATVRLAASAKQLAAGAGAAAAAAARKDDEGGVSTPPHQGTPAAKAGPGTPESPPLLPLPHRA